ncbi:Predicted arabinose efflux permease, MFS family [Sporobacter termitidis DSM 10068]|uniref:Predicted arabinose efflux permease, MFS family n=1 Tax=Sporobacter termitidis DSM 10068 TaxID=1123282 RepID=A0A1M5WGT1_9FIRM|nr:MFS transporter [Sporobacter termitidis]SHH86680.1 Predicted arabinose efflux permease, MFS family [Sporobacter termitidis DSM 10068]
MSIFRGITWRIMIPVMLIGIFQAAFQSFSTVLADIAKVFPDQSPTLIQSILTIPSLVTIPVSLLVGILASYVTKKNLVLFALSSMFLGGVLPLAIHSSVYALIVSSVLIGIGQGFLITIASAILAEHFDGVARGTTMGLKQAASGVGQAALTILTGYLCVLAWYKAYYVYFLVLPIIVLTAIFLPKGKLDVKLVGKGVGASGFRSVFTPSLIYMCILFFLLGMLEFAFYTNIAMSMTSKGLGDASAIGVATAFNNITTILIGLVLGYILRAFRKYTMALAMLIIGVSYFILAFAQNLTAVSIGGLVFGIGAGIQMPAALYYIIESVSKTACSLAISISMALVSLGVSMSPIIINAIAQCFGKVDGTSGLFVAGAIYIILLVVEAVREAVFNKNSAIGVSNNKEMKGMSS